MTAWIERYRRQAEERYRRLDEVLAAMPDEAPDTPRTPKTLKTLPTKGSRP
jgi:hypothetical protein